MNLATIILAAVLFSGIYVHIPRSQLPTMGVSAPLKKSTSQPGKGLLRLGI
jgi:uncharacterized iron-regulated membrane protein